MVHRKVRDEDGGDDQLDEAGHPAPGRRSEQRRKDSGRKRPDQVNCSASELAHHRRLQVIVVILQSRLENSLKRARISILFLI